MTSCSRLSAVLQQLQIPSDAAAQQPLTAAEEPPPGGGWGQHYDFYRPSPDVPLYNTCKAKLLAGEQVFSCPVDRFNVEGYLEARKHWDFIFFEMQHSTMSYKDVEAMIKAGALSGEPGAIPFIRMHSPATEHVFQQCSDIGALGFIVPTVDTPEQAQEASKWARFPPVARRSTGVGQAPRVWHEASGGKGYAATYNDNVVLVVMIETPVGIANAYEIASTPGVDVVLIGNFDLQVFSGTMAGTPEFTAMLESACADVKRAGKIFGTTMPDQASGMSFSGDAQFFYTGPTHDGWESPEGGLKVCAQGY